jgi:hypothetical protein
MTGRLLAILIAGAALAHAAAAQTPATPPPENTGPNTGIVRWAAGKYLYRTADGARERGWERFHLNVHPDGSRTMIMWHDLYARNNQFSVMLRVAADFRPLESYLTYWTPNGYKGSNFISLGGGTLSAVVNGPLGQITQRLAVPERISVGTHPVAADGWHTWYEDAKAKGPQKGTLYSVEATADVTKPPLGTLIPFEFERLGRETITTPAGRFETVKYKLGGASEAWLLEQDKIMVRVLNAPRNLDYVLTEFASGDTAKK